MPVAAKVPERTLIRTEAELEQATLMAAPNPLIVCSNVKCNLVTRDSEKRVLIVGVFRCSSCFMKIVRNQKLRFGVSEEATEEEIMGLLKPCDHPVISNLYTLRAPPAFVSILKPPLCA